ncbi:phage baseplate protein [Spartinivicinus ruber]|uniref:phage baseplate protein n=1 Tax=Spartinivicinus ruber TaxID=2683272 RepID=UPI0013D52FD2|nr:phage baseplate protein [Spartinivicinus ruber]
MIGIDRTTGKTLAEIPQLKSRLQQVLSTPVGARIKRRAFGSRVPDLLGRNVSPEAALKAQVYTLEALINPANGVLDFQCQVCRVTVNSDNNGFAIYLHGLWQDQLITLEFAL